MSEITTYKEYEQNFKEQLFSLDISFLINNAGLGQGFPAEKCDDKYIQDLVSVNCIHPVYLTKLILPHLESQDHRSSIINVASVMNYHAMKGFSIYSASKKFLSYFSIGLAHELMKENSKVDITDYRPAFVATKLSKVKEGFLRLSTDVAAECALRDVGKKLTTSACIDHEIQVPFFKWASSNIPSLFDFVMMKGA